MNGHWTSLGQWHAKNPYLSGVFAPVKDEIDTLDLPVIGKIPEDLGRSRTLAFRAGVRGGQNVFREAEAAARRNGWAFNWRLAVVPGVGHSARTMFGSDQALAALRP
jgi:hypothetical protein